MGDVLIQGLTTGDCADRICVRVSRFWEFYGINDESRLLHADMVLIDEEGKSIHAQIYPKDYERFKTLIKEGSVYNFECFWVKKSNDKFKPVTNENMLTFSKWTTIEEVLDIPPAFPVFTYSLTSIEQVPCRFEYAEYYTDAIGIVTAISNLMTYQMRGRQSETLKRVVTIRSESNASANVVLWDERASSFPAEKIHKDGEASPQVVIFVGTLVKKYSDGICLSGSAPCKWYINPEVPEAKALVASIGSIHQPIKWDQHVKPTTTTSAAEAKKISEIRDLNPFKNKKNEFLVTVTIRKIDSSWWYNSCEKCYRTTKPYGDLYKCTEPKPKCGYIGKPTQRYKLSIIAGDETGDTNFVMFGRWVQRLTKKSAVTLIAENPQGFIPNEITRLLEKTFEWNVSFTDSTKSSGNTCFQVNAIVGEINDMNSFPPMTPTGSQSSSLMFSQGAGTSIQRTPQKCATFPLLSPTSHASSATPTKKAVNIPELPVTPQSHRCTNEDEVTPVKGAELTLPLPEEDIDPIDAPVTLTQDTTTMSPATPHDNHNINVTKSTSSNVAQNSTTKTHTSVTKKRTRNSPNKKVAKKLLLDEVTGNEDDGCADATAKPSPSAGI